MDAAALRAMQAPIKERYKADPDAAFITLSAKGALDDTRIACKIETGRALALAGLHPATGGSGLELCSGDMLLEALVACAGVTLKAVATALDIPLGPARCRPKAISTFAARSASPRTRRSASPGSGCASTSTTDAPQEKLDQLLKLTERYCVVYQTIKSGPPVEVGLNRI